MSNSDASNASSRHANTHVAMCLRSLTPVIGLLTVSSTSRFSSRHGVAQLTVILRKPTPITDPSLGSSSRRMFSHDALLQNSFSTLEASRHSESAARTCQRGAEARCPCRLPQRVDNVGRGAGRSPFLDAALTAFMGIGIGKPQFWTVHRFCVDSLPLDGLTSRSSRASCCAEGLALLCAHSRSTCSGP